MKWLTKGCHFDSPFQTGELYMKTKKVELLAPAGCYESFLGAIHAGADAVYLAGNQFGARAYADNFTKEEVCNAIRYAHVFQRKVYLTVNILLKDEEINVLYEYLKPFYDCGLDGVIIQDLGAFQMIKEKFPGLELHVSTQMTISGVYGARLLKELGACRIVPARELSINEIKKIKRTVDIEIETFVHGAMCYCYSGACLFSSMLGGRSGNRGRCAQPCRLPYEVLEPDKRLTKEEQYVLSLKDMCTIQMIPELIESGIDSFKIEGRMKRPEYAAGVTALYRKYIDLYVTNPENFAIMKEDIESIKKLYIRSELQNGYYLKHNGKEMVTLLKPSYSGLDDQVLNEIREKYIIHKKQLEVEVKLILSVGKPMICTVFHKDSDTTITVAGQMVELAAKRPVDKESIRKQMAKTGTSNFYFSAIKIEMDTEIFIPLKAINELRRNALAQLESKLIDDASRILRQASISHKIDEKVNTVDIVKNVFINKRTNGLYAVVSTEEQFYALLEHDVIKRIYLSSDCLFGRSGTVKELMLEFSRQSTKHSISFYLAMPYMIRERSYKYLEELEKIIHVDNISGVLIRNIETLGWLRKIGYEGKVVADAQLYCFNRKSKAVISHMTDTMTVPYELNEKEIYRLGLTDMEIPVYGRIPMMITANCIQRTAIQCQKNLNCNGTLLELRDRYKKKFPVVMNCNHCFNIIYNSQPTSLHGYLSSLLRHGVEGIRLDFTIENKEEVNKITRFFESMYHNPELKIELPFKEYTKGHLGRGVE